MRLRTAQEVAAFGQLGSTYLEGYGEIQFEEVVVEKGDGRRVNVTNGLVEEVNPFGVTATSLSADVRFKKLTIPGLEPGDRLSYRLTHRHKPLAPGRAFGEMKLWPSASSPLQTYELDLPHESPIKVRLRKGIEDHWEEVASAPDRLVRRLSLAAPPSGEGEKASKEEQEELATPDVIFSSFDSWKAVSSWWWGISKERLAPDGAVGSEAKAVVASAKEPREALAALHAFVTTRIRYLNVSFGLGRMQPRRAPEVLANRYGDCKDKHALLAAMAASLGIDVRPVLINSSRPLREEIPSPQQFDHMISVARLGSAPEEWLWLDGTNPFAGPGHLLPNLRDKRALLVEANGEGVIVRTPRDPPFRARQEVLQKGTLSPDGVLRTRVTWILRGDSELVLRSLFATVPQEKRTAALQSGVAQVWKDDKLENLTISDPLDVANAVRIEFDAERTFAATGDERRLELTFPPIDVPEAIDDPPAGVPAVSFPYRDVVERAEIELQEGQRARSPLSVSLERPFGGFRSTYSAEGRSLKLERRMSLNQGSLPATEAASYEAFRRAIQKDHDQEFTITGLPAPTGAVTARELRDEGLAAFRKNDFTRAMELFTKATETDPKVEDGFLDLGRALHHDKRYEQAVQAFTRQVEMAPFHEHAYAWRAWSREQLGRWAEAEQDLLKQIEVAPFQGWSYEKLGQRRETQGRFQEAVDLYSRAATLAPKEAQRWLDLGRAQAAAGLGDEARQSLLQAVGQDPVDWMKVHVATVYRSLGDVESAGRLATEALASLAKRLAALTPEGLDEGDRYWVSRLVEAWRYVGEAAAAAGEGDKAERYLHAAWRLDFSPQAAWALGELREKQGRLADAVELWNLAAAALTTRTAIPADAYARIRAASARLPEASARAVAGAQGRLIDLRTIRLQGRPLDNLTEEVLLLAGLDGRVERVLNLSRKTPEAFAKQLAALGPIRLDWPRPDEHAHKAVRRGLFVCSPASGCAVVLDIPGLQSLSEGNDWREGAKGQGAVQPVAQGSLRLVKLEPSEGTALRPGATVTIVATCRYSDASDGSFVAMVVQDPNGRSLVQPTPNQAVRPGEGEVTLSATVTIPAEASWVAVYLGLNAPALMPSMVKATSEVR